VEEERLADGELDCGRVGADPFELANVGCLLGFRAAINGQIFAILSRFTDSWPVLFAYSHLCRLVPK